MYTYGIRILAKGADLFNAKMAEKFDGHSGAVKQYGYLHAQNYQPRVTPYSNGKDRRANAH
jgi:hypothetical protein